MDNNMYRPRDGEQILPNPAPAGPSNESVFLNVSSNLSKRRRTDFGPESADCIANTEVETEEVSFLWTVKNISTLDDSEGLKSPIFRGVSKKSHSWQLKMWPKKKLEEENYLAIRVMFKKFWDNVNTVNSSNPVLRTCKARVQFSILDPEGNPVKQMGNTSGPLSSFNKFRWLGYENFMLSSDLMAPSKRLVVDDSIKIHCRLLIVGEPKHKVAIGKAATHIASEEVMWVKRKEKLFSDIGKMFKDSVLTDVAIHTQRSTFMAHKNVLAARSPVFAAMFSTNMLENEHGVVKIMDFTDDVVEGMLEYIYKGEIKLVDERVVDLLRIAEKYDLSDLKEGCEFKIAEYKYNALEMLVMANLYNANYLKPRVMDYINTNKEEIGKTKSFKELAQAHPDTFVDLYLSQ